MWRHVCCRHFSSVEVNRNRPERHEFAKRATQEFERVGGEFQITLISGAVFVEPHFSITQI